MEKKKIMFGNYQKIPGLNVNHQGVPVTIEGPQITIKTSFFTKRQFSIYDVKEIYRGKTAFNIPFIGLKVNSKGKEIIHLLTTSPNMFPLNVGITMNADKELEKIFDGKVSIRQVEDKIITGKSLRIFLKN